jgi:hypothetical protein
MNSANHHNEALPPLPPHGATGARVCEVVQLYLSIIDDLPADQVRVLMEHVRGCANCAAAQRSLQLVTDAFTRLPETAPSARVDQAVWRAIAAHNTGQSIKQAERANIPSYRPRAARRGQFRRSWVGITLATAVVATLLLALIGTFYFSGNIVHTPPAFALPSNLTWNGYVAYQTQALLDGHGNRYQVITYYNLQTGEMHTETEMDNTLDVVAIASGGQTLGLDMMHHVAQMNADAWMSNESMLNLAALRKGLQTGQDVFVDVDTFKGQQVYRIRAKNGLTLLLDMDYMPVNVLRGAVGPGTGQPVYNKFQLIPTPQVPDSTWNMNVPSGFKMGTLPAKP